MRCALLAWHAATCKWEVGLASSPPVANTQQPTSTANMGIGIGDRRAYAYGELRAFDFSLTRCRPAGPQRAAPQVQAQATQITQREEIGHRT
jgi:hypothetical protein